MDCMSSLVVPSPYTFDYEDEASRVVDYNEGLIAIPCSRSSFSLEGVASASILTALVQVAHESMLMCE